MQVKVTFCDGVQVPAVKTVCSVRYKQGRALGVHRRYEVTVRVRGLAEERVGEALVALGDDDASILARITTRSRDALQLHDGLEVFARVKTVSLS